MKEKKVWCQKLAVGAMVLALAACGEEQTPAPNSFSVLPMRGRIPVTVSVGNSVCDALVVPVHPFEGQNTPAGTLRKIEAERNRVNAAVPLAWNFFVITTMDETGGFVLKSFGHINEFSVAIHTNQLQSANVGAAIFTPANGRTCTDVGTLESALKQSAVIRAMVTAQRNIIEASDLPATPEPEPGTCTSDPSRQQTQQELAATAKGMLTTCDLTPDEWSRLVDQTVYTSPDTLNKLCLVYVQEGGARGLTPGRSVGRWTCGLDKNNKPIWDENTKGYPPARRV